MSTLPRITLTTSTAARIAACSWHRPAVDYCGGNTQKWGSVGLNSHTQTVTILVIKARIVEYQYLVSPFESNCLFESTFTQSLLFAIFHAELDLSRTLISN